MRFYLVIPAVIALILMLAPTVSALENYENWENTPLQRIIHGDWWGGLWAPYSPIQILGEIALFVVFIVAQVALYIKLQDVAPVSISIIIWSAVLLSIMGTPIKFVMACFAILGVAAVLWRLLKK